MHLTMDNLPLDSPILHEQDFSLHIVSLCKDELHAMDKDKIVLAINVLSFLSSHCDIENTAYVLD